MSHQSTGVETISELWRELRRCGWEPAALPAGAKDLQFQTFQGVPESVVQIFQGAGGGRLLLVGLEHARLAEAHDLFPRFLNMPIETRMALAAARSLARAQWLLLVTASRIELYSLPEETCLCRLRREEDDAHDLLAALVTIGAGRVPAGLGSSPLLPAAEPLRGWLRHWALQLASVLQIPADAGERLIWRWILMLQWARASETELNGGWGLQARQEQGSWIVSFEASTATVDLCEALAQFDDRYATALFDQQGEREDLDAVVRRLHRIEDTPLLDRFRAELLMHAQERFAPETVAWLFTDLQREQAGWQRDIGGLGGTAPLRKRLSSNGWLIYEPITCDIGQFGLTAALRDADRLSEYIHELALLARHPGGAGSSLAQPDLFMAMPRGVDASGELSDGINYLFGEALRLTGIEPERRLGVGVTFLLKALALARRTGWPLQRIDTLDALMGY